MGGWMDGYSSVLALCRAFAVWLTHSISLPTPHLFFVCAPETHGAAAAAEAPRLHVCAAPSGGYLHGDMFIYLYICMYGWMDG